MMTSSPNSLIRKANLQYAGVQSAYWVCFFCLFGYAVVQLEEKGYSNVEIGILLAVQSIVSIFAQPIISAFAEKHRNIPLKRFISVQLIVSILAVASLYFLKHSMPVAIFLFSAFGASIYSSLSLINAIAMQLTNAGIHINYGLGRGCGSLMFSVAGILVGKLVQARGVVMIIPSYILCASIMLVIVATMTKPPALSQDIPKADSIRKSYGSGVLDFIRNNKVFFGFCLASVFLFASHACLNTYVPNIVTALGGNREDQGITRSIAAFVELPVMMAGAFLVAKMKSKRLLIIASFFFTVKALATVFTGSLWVLFAVQLLQMPAYALYLPASVYFANESTGEGDRVRAQAYANVAGMGVGYVVGNLVGGALLDRYETVSVSIAATVFGAIGFAFMVFSLSSRSRHNPPNDSGSNSESEKTLQVSALS
jgi:PPP family 3-phenylpropionic acid transporter